jgi:hypothetical protein
MISDKKIVILNAPRPQLRENGIIGIDKQNSNNSRNINELLICQLSSPSLFRFLRHALKKIIKTKRAEGCWLNFFKRSQFPKFEE